MKKNTELMPMEYVRGDLCYTFFDRYGKTYEFYSFTRDTSFYIVRTKKGYICGSLRNIITHNFFDFIAHSSTLKSVYREVFERANYIGICDLFKLHDECKKVNVFEIDENGLLSGAYSYDRQDITVDTHDNYTVYCIFDLNTSYYKDKELYVIKMPYKYMSRDFIKNAVELVKKIMANMKGGD